MKLLASNFATSDKGISEKFKIFKDSVKHTEGAFDSDYTYYLTIEYDKLEEKNIIEKITQSTFFDTTETMNYKDQIWAKEGKGFIFLQCNN